MCAEEAARARSNIYRLLAGAFLREPTPAFLEALRASPLRELLEAHGVAFSPAFHAAPADRLAEELAVEFARLFLGPGRHLPPHESVARGEGRYWGDSTVAVVKAYRAQSFAPRPDGPEIPDHLGLELEFLGALAEEEAAEEEEGRGDAPRARALRAARSAFLSGHLLAWAPAYLERVAGETGHEFFRAMAHFARRFLLADAENPVSDS